MGLVTLTTYGTSVASSTLSSAGTLATATGGASATKTSLVGTATQYGQLYALGNAGGWLGAGSIQNPDGNGFLLDSTLLEGATLAGGTYTPTVRMRLSAHTCTADVILRAYKRSSGGSYTNIGTWTITGQSFTNANVNYTPTPSSVSAVSFGVGDKLYEDVWLNITASTMQAGDTVQLAISSTSSGLANDVQLVTQGYFPTYIGGLHTLMGVG